MTINRVWQMLGDVRREARIVVFNLAAQNLAAQWQCLDCGALVAHVDRHNDWHAEQETT